MARRYCKKCGTMQDEKEFYLSHNVEKYPPDGRMDICKKCITMHLDPWDTSTFFWILEELDVPYIQATWNNILEKYGKDPKKLQTTTILGRYISVMKLKQNKDYRWADTEKLRKKDEEEQIIAMKSQGFSDEEIAEQLQTDRTPEKPKELVQWAPVARPSTGTAITTDEDGFAIVADDEEDEFMSELTDDDKTYLRLKWGKNYRAEEWVRMEQLYNDMMESYDITSAGHKDTLIMICKASLKTNQLLDAGQIDDAQKMSKVYDNLMKSGRFTAAQNKEDKGEAVDSVSELVAICEKEQFIPKFYIDKPNDKIDRIIQDMQEYTRDLVVNELGLANLIENSVKSLEREKEAIQEAARMGKDIEEQMEAELFDYETPVLTDEDFLELQDVMDNEEEYEE